MDKIKNTVRERFWGEEIDTTAAKQLGLDESHTVFMMGSEVDYTDDLREGIDELREYGLCSVDEVVDHIEERIVHVKLPKGFALVGMCPLGASEPKTYGVVDLSAHGRG